MTVVNTATRATLASAEAIAIAIVAKLVSSSSGSVAVSPSTRNSDNAFVLAIVAKLDVGVATAATPLKSQHLRSSSYFLEMQLQHTHNDRSQ